MRHCGETVRKLVFFDHDDQPMRVTHAFPVRRNAIGRFLACNRADDHACFEHVAPQPGERVYALRWEEVQTFVNGGDRWSHVPPTILRFHVAHVAQVQWMQTSDAPWWFRCDCCDHTRWEQDVEVHYQAVFAPRPIAFVRGRPARSPQGEC
jgi:hypothetical protein